MDEYFFRRYRNGKRMAEDVRITKATTLEEACLSASRIAAQYNDGTTLVYEPDVAERDALRAELAAANARLEAFGKHKDWSIEYKSPVYGDDDDQERCWVVHKEEWIVIGKGNTPAGAIDAALANRGK